MNPSTPSSGRSAAPRWHAWVWFCLALSLLYNPYLAAPSSGNGVNVRHPASNRATVGSSELQHFSPAEDRSNFSPDAASGTELLLPLPEVASHATNLMPQVVSPRQQFFGSGLWFRPPPAL